MAEESEKLGS